MVELDGFRDSPLHESKAQASLVVFRIGMPFNPCLSKPTRIAEKASMGEPIIEVDEGDHTHIRYLLVSTSIQFPYLMGVVNSTSLAFR